MKFDETQSASILGEAPDLVIKWVVLFLIQAHTRTALMGPRDRDPTLPDSLEPIYMRSPHPEHLEETARISIKNAINKEQLDRDESCRLWSVSEQMIAELRAKRLSRVS